MATDSEREINVRDLSMAVGASKRARLLQAVLAAAAIIALLAFVDVLRPGANEITVASGTLRTLDSAPEKRIPPTDPPAPSSNSTTTSRPCCRTKRTNSRPKSIPSNRPKHKTRKPSSKSFRTRNRLRRLSSKPGSNPLIQD